MTNSPKPWWSAEVIAAREEEVRAGLDATAHDIRNDFASYKSLANGDDVISSGLFLHNEYELWRINTICRDYHRIASRYLRRVPRSAIDLGCGAGFTTDGLKRVWSSASIFGVDVSVDAISFAQRQFPSCHFIARAIDPGDLFESGPFDFVLCQEFYPFTRTGSLESHQEWLRLLINNLTVRGIAVIMVSSVTEDSINDTFDRLSSEFALRKVAVATPRIGRYLSFRMSRCVAFVLRVIRPASVRNLYILTK